jgi:CheY-like chemotaxis protein
VWVQHRFSKDIGSYEQVLKGEPNDEIKKLLIAKKQKIGLRNWVNTKGGEYFFSPSISALRSLRARLMVVDDEISFARSLEDALEKYRFEVTTFSDVNKVRLNFRKGEFDFVLCDSRLPLTNAVQLYQIFNDNDSSVNVCFMLPPDEGGVSLKRELKKRYRNSYSRIFFIKKPFSIDDSLVDKIRGYIAKL